VSQWFDAGEITIHAKRLRMIPLASKIEGVAHLHPS
jgi:hypothetical protein